MKDIKLKNKIIISVIILLILVIIGGVVILIYQNKSNNKVDKNESVEMQKTYEKIANANEITFTTTLDDQNKETIIIKNDQAYKETMRNSVTYKYIVNGEDTYFLDDSNKKYYTYKNNTEISTEIQQKLSKLKEMSSQEGKKK